MTIEPLVSASVDLRDFPFTPMLRARLFGSSFHARVSDSGWRAGVTLWLKSWEQVPAGSLPDDDIDLCRLAELGRDMKQWKKVKAEALWGWEKASDDRLYHKTVAEVVNEAWERKCSQRNKTAAARAAKEAKRLSQPLSQNQSPSVTEPVKDVVTGSKGREGKGREEIYPPAPPSARENLDHLEHELRRAAGAENNPSPGWMVLAPIIGLMDQGADLNEEILPAIRAKPNPNARSLDYFVPQIQEFRARRRRAADAPLPNGTGPPAKRNLAIAHFEERAATYDKSADEPYVPNANRA